MFEKLRKAFSKINKRSVVRKIEISKASLPTLWYADKIGSTFKVNPYLEKEGWYAVELPYSNGYVKYEDCKVIE